MKDINWTEFTRKIPVCAKLNSLYDAWTKTSELEKWFLSKAAFYGPDKKQIEKTKGVIKGSSYSWNWYLFDVTENGKITEANGKDFLQFTFVGCVVDVKLKEQNDSVIVELTQRNIPTDDQSKKEIRLGCDSGWSFFLVNLKSVYEGGIDLRNKKDEFKGMVNN